VFVADANPYPHWILEPFPREFLLKLKDEMLSLGSTMKETDLFRINQTVDFANLSSVPQLADQCPQLNELKRTLYSESFRSHIEQVTNCGKLNTRVDCAGNMSETKNGLCAFWLICCFPDTRKDVIWVATMIASRLVASAIFCTCPTRFGPEKMAENSNCMLQTAGCRKKLFPQDLEPW
jgi:hypothetical protein